jgi:hypothetical protein
MGRALCLARGGLLFFSTGFSRHRIAAGALFSVVQHNPCIRVFGDGIFGTGQGAVRLSAMVTEQRLKIGCLLYHPNHPGTNTKAVFLLAGNFTGVATTAVLFIEH